MQGCDSCSGTLFCAKLAAFLGKQVSLLTYHHPLLKQRLISVNLSHGMAQPTFVHADLACCSTLHLQQTSSTQDGTYCVMIPAHCVQVQGLAESARGQ